MPDSPRSGHVRETAESAVTAAELPSPLTPRGRQRGDGSFAAAPPLGASTASPPSSSFSLLPSPRQQPQQAAPSLSHLLPSLWAQWSDGQSGGRAAATELMSPRSAVPVTSLQQMSQGQGLMTSPRLAVPSRLQGQELTSPSSAVPPVVPPLSQGEEATGPRSAAAAPPLQPLQRSRQFRAAADCLVAITEDTSAGGPCPFAPGATFPRKNPRKNPRKTSSLKPMLAANETCSAIHQPQVLPLPPSAEGATAAVTAPPPLLLLSPRSRTLLPRSRALSRKLVEMHGQQAPEVGMVMGRHPAGASGMGGPQGLLGRIKGWVTGTSIHS